MNIEDRWNIIDVVDQVLISKRVLTRLDRKLKRGRNEMAEAYPELLAALDRYVAAADEVEQLVDKLLDEDSFVTEPKEFTDDESQRLRNLNHAISTISDFMHGTADPIRSAMQAKVDNGRDPMWDFEIEAKIDYQLREDDPEYDENMDNYLSSRSEHLARKCDGETISKDWRGSLTPEPFRHEPLSWLLHSLTEHKNGPEGPRVDARNCLRIGTVFLDIQVWWQYAFDVAEGKWVKRWRQPEGIPEYVEPTA
jgi:hypothetical protein